MQTTATRKCAQCGKEKPVTTFRRKGNYVYPMCGQCRTIVKLPGKKSETLQARILRNVKIDEKTGCWLWQAHLNRDGYGTVSFRNQHQILAHRAAWEAWCGEVPDGLEVCHRCDTPRCVRPDHLFVATHQENMIDSRQKGRWGGWRALEWLRSQTPEYWAARKRRKDGKFTK